MLNEAFGQNRSLSNIPRPPSSRIRSPFWNQAIAQNALSGLVDPSQQQQQQQQQGFQLPSHLQHNSVSPAPPLSSGGGGRLQQPHMHFSDRAGSLSARPASASGSAVRRYTQDMEQRKAEFRALSVATPPDPLRKMPAVPRARDAAEEIMGQLTPAEYVRSELDTFEALKRRHLAHTNRSDHSFPDFDQLEQRLASDKFAQHQREKERIRGSNTKTRNEKLTDGYVNFRGTSYVRYLVPLESTLTRTLRWLFDLRELNVHPVTRMMRENRVTVEHFANEWLRLHIGASREAGTSILCDALTRFVQEHILRNVYVTGCQLRSWYELLCDKKGTSLDFSSAMTKLSLILLPEIDDSISAWFTRMFFSGAYIMFRAHDNATPSEFFHIVDALETLVDNSLKRGAIEHKLRETPASGSSSTTSLSGGAAEDDTVSKRRRGAAAGGGGGGAVDEFDTNRPQGIMRLLSVVRADIDAYANAVSSRAVRRVDDVLMMFSEEGTLRRLMLCNEYASSTAKYYTMATRKLQQAKAARERAILRSKSILMGRRLSGADGGGDE
jgi:hypothetical protein